MLLPLFIVAAATIAVSIPYVFTQVRDATKQRRKGIVTDLQTIFQIDSSSHTSIPSFEFVKYKYFRGAGSADKAGTTSEDFQPMEWLIGSLPLVVSLFAMNLLCMLVLARTAFGIDLDIGISWLRTATAVPVFPWVMLTAYAGALLFMLRAFNQAIDNFDLSPLSYVGATVNLAFGLALALLMAFVILRLPGPVADPNPNGRSFPIVILSAFLAGYFPDVALRTVIRFGHLRFYKQDNEQLFKVFKAVPVEIIDGIDSDIRTRLADYHINSVQNLAAANPLMLFVETPYGVYEIMDWVAQAQLCASVGPDLLLSFWHLGIRTIFDLERIVSDQACYDEVLLQEIGAILWRDQGGDPKVAAGRTAAHLDAPPGIATILADLRFRLECPHVHRLRQIFNQVSWSIGDEARRLPPLLTAHTGAAGPFRYRRHRTAKWPHRRTAPACPAAGDS